MYLFTAFSVLAIARPSYHPVASPVDKLQTDAQRTEQRSHSLCCRFIAPQELRAQD
jgi:hypothetical protein